MKNELWNFAGQLYAKTGTKQVVKKNGEQVVVNVWVTHCADCGEKFQFTARMSEKYLMRRCIEHASPGLKVKRHVLWDKPVPLDDLLN